MEATDVYAEDPETGERTVVEIHLDFHHNDITPGYENDMSEALTIEAQRWMEAEEPSRSAAATTAPVIHVERLPALRGGATVFIQDEIHFVNSLFLESGITEAGARAYQEFLEYRAKLWRRKDGEG
ncbi:hypothetical protein [Streptomyces sp. PR69]|uniref:hypothetical protein n=1 Tax=Streptomyces sp. PR69 TaxID=2984950 RepID=UPI0022650346|nr:hypothetical protein [Streptomyces sp. PR69]